MGTKRVDPVEVAYERLQRAREQLRMARALVRAWPGDDHYTELADTLQQRVWDAEWDYIHVAPCATGACW